MTLYLLITEDNTITQSPTITVDDLSACDEGRLAIVRIAQVAEGYGLLAHEVIECEFYDSGEWLPVPAPILRGNVCTTKQ